MLHTARAVLEMKARAMTQCHPHIPLSTTLRRSLITTGNSTTPHILPEHLCAKICQADALNDHTGAGTFGDKTLLQK